MTIIDGLLAVAVLVGLVLNAALGWWWADPLAALVIVYYGVKEEPLSGKQPCDADQLPRLIAQRP